MTDATTNKINENAPYPRGHNWEGLMPEQISNAYKNPQTKPSSIASLRVGESRDKMETNVKDKTADKSPQVLSLDEEHAGDFVLSKNKIIDEFSRRLKIQINENYSFHSKGLHYEAYEIIDKIAEEMKDEKEH